jgi:hypothetical protein
MYSFKNFGSLTDVAQFWNYWDYLKNSISEILGFGPKVYDLQTQYDKLARRADAAGATDVGDEARAGSQRTSSIYDVWATIKSKLDDWLPSWMKAAGEATESGTSGLGVLFVLPAWAIAMLIAGGLAAIAYVVTNWQQVSANYSYEKDVLDAVKQKVISAEEAAKILPGEDGGGGGVSDILQKAGNVGTIALVLLGGMFIYNFVGGMKKHA